MERGSVENGHQRALTTAFGQVVVARKAYRQRGHPNLHPADGELNLPPEQYSHTLRKLAAIEASRGSYDEAVEAIQRQARQRLGKRQVEELAMSPISENRPLMIGSKPATGVGPFILY